MSTPSLSARPALLLDLDGTLVDSVCGKSASGSLTRIPESVTFADRAPCLAARLPREPFKPRGRKRCAVSDL